VANYDYLRCKTVDDAIAAGDWVVAMHPTPVFSSTFLRRPARTRKVSRFQSPMAS
jgi:hypothetical protein